MVIDGKPVEIIEYNGHKVITTKVMAEHHGLDVKVMNQKFRRNKKYFELDIDYFIITKEMVKKSGIQSVTQKILDLFTQNNMDEIFLFTESGYLRFVKTINDDRAWEIYGQLMQAYFEKRGILPNAGQMLAKSKEHRKGITSQWSKHGGTDFSGLTTNTYNAVFNDSSKRKAKMNGDELTLLSVFEYLESKKLENNNHIQGNSELKMSTNNTASRLIDIIAPQEKCEALE